MQSDDLQRFAVAMKILATTFRVEMSAELVSCYEMGLADLPMVSIELAVRKAVQECEFMPPPAKLRTLAAPKKRETFGAPPSFGPGHWAWEKAELEAREERAKQRITSGKAETVGRFLPAMVDGLRPRNAGEHS